MAKPFSWSSVRPRLASLAPPAASPRFVQGIQTCCAKVLARSGDSDLIFVGRSPESLYDYLSGVLAGTSWETRCRLLNYSNRYQSVAHLQSSIPGAVRAMRAQLRWFDLDPRQFSARRRVAFVDLVSGGSTLGHLTEFMVRWAKDETADADVVLGKLRFVGVTIQTQTSPKTWRWQQHVPWARRFPARAIKNVSVPGPLWCYLGNEQAKVFESNPPEKWTDAAVQLRSRFGVRTAALQTALYLHQQGRDRRQRQAFLKALTAEPAMRHGWLRTLMSEIRQTGG